MEWRGGIREEIIALFLLSPEVEEIVRQVYSTKLAKEEEITNIKAIRKIFLTLFFQFVSSYPDTEFQEDQLEEAADFLFEALMRGCDLFLDQAIHEGALTAHEAKTAFRHNIIYSEIKVLQKKLNFLIASPTIDIQAILTFEEQYRQQVGRRHGYITPPNFDAVRKIPIDNLYVHPKIFSAKERQKERELFDTNTFFSRMYRAVLLGNPGGGKSTLTLKLCYDLAIHSTERLVAGRSHLTPILVILRDYAANKKSHQWSILEFIVPSPKVTRDIVVACVEHIFLLGIVLLDKWGAAGDIDSDKPEKLLTLLFSSLSENRPTVVDAFESFLANKFNNGSEQDAFLALEICIMASVRVDHIFDRCPERTLLLCPKVLLVCNRAFFHGKVTVEDFIEWHGVSNLFRVCLHVIRRNSYSLPPASIIIKDVFLLNTLKQSRSLQALRSVGHILPSYPLPWIKQAYLYECILSFPHQIFKAFYTSEKMTDTPQAWHADELFGAFLLCAVWLEAQDLSEQAIYINMLKTKALPLFGLMRWTLIAHFEPVTVDKIQAEFDNCKFTAEQQHFIQQWLRREVNLVE